MTSLWYQKCLWYFSSLLSLLYIFNVNALSLLAQNYMTFEGYRSSPLAPVLTKWATWHFARNVAPPPCQNHIMRLSVNTTNQSDAFGLLVEISVRLSVKLLWLTRLCIVWLPLSWLAIREAAIDSRTTACPSNTRKCRNTFAVFMLAEMLSAHAHWTYNGGDQGARHAMLYYVSRYVSNIFRDMTSLKCRPSEYCEASSMAPNMAPGSLSKWVSKWLIMLSLKN